MRSAETARRGDGASAGGRRRGLRAIRPLAVPETTGRRRCGGGGGAPLRGGGGHWQAKGCYLNIWRYGYGYGYGMVGCGYREVVK